jgi:hypothetical protein
MSRKKVLELAQWNYVQLSDGKSTGDIVYCLTDATLMLYATGGGFGDGTFTRCQPHEGEQAV